MHPFFVNSDISLAHTISTEVYKSQQFFEEAKEKIFAPGWQFIGDTQMVGTNGSCFPFILLENYINEPLLLTRDANEDIHCLSNVCTHRGNLLVTESCNNINLRCKYHGRLFGLDGRFKSMPEFKEVKNFPTANDDLSKLPLFTWGNLLFTSLQQKYEASVFFKDMIDRLSWLPLHEFKFHPALSKDYYVNANWALYCENYLEGFHIPFVHEALNTAIDFTDYTTEIFYPFSSLQLGISRYGKDCFDIPVSSPDHGKKIAAYYFWVFPNMMFNFYPWGLSINIVQPLAVDKTRVQFLSYVWKEDLLHAGAGADLDKVEKEDEAIVENVQKGIQSRFYTQGRYSVTREKGTHHFHELLAKFIA
ncbi:MAG: aromatic ring-hydroxylating dioxygenase subunit alpha [Ferruginibacter sp.]